MSRAKFSKKKSAIIFLVTVLTVNVGGWYIHNDFSFKRLFIVGGIVIVLNGIIIGLLTYKEVVRDIQNKIVED